MASSSASERLRAEFLASARALFAETGDGTEIYHLIHQVVHKSPASTAEPHAQVSTPKTTAKMTGEKHQKTSTPTTFPTVTAHPKTPTPKMTGKTLPKTTADSKTPPRTFPKATADPKTPTPKTTAKTFPEATADPKTPTPKTTAKTFAKATAVPKTPTSKTTVEPTPETAAEPRSKTSKTTSKTTTGDANPIVQSSITKPQKRVTPTTTPLTYNVKNQLTVESHANSAGKPLSTTKRSVIYQATPPDNVTPEADDMESILDRFFPIQASPSPVNTPSKKHTLSEPPNETTPIKKTKKEVEKLPKKKKKKEGSRYSKA